MPLKNKRLVLGDMNGDAERSNYRIQDIILLSTAFIVQLIVILLWHKFGVREINAVFGEIGDCDERNTFVCFRWWLMVTIGYRDTAFSKGMHISGRTG